jgi:hypothetical protein
MRNSASGASIQTVGGCLGMIALLIGITVPISAAWSQTSESAARQYTAPPADFGSRVSQYLELRLREAGPPSRPSNSSEKLVEQTQQMAGKIRTARAGAKQGSIFSLEITRYFRHQIALSLRGPDGKKIRATLKHSESLPGVALRVNDSYTALPLPTMPPSLLQRLPIVPKQLAYRTIGHALVLHDIEPNIIVDFIPDAFPPP